MIQLTPRQTELLAAAVRSGADGYCVMADQVRVTPDLLVLARHRFISVPKGSVRAIATPAGHAFASRSAL